MLLRILLFIVLIVVAYLLWRRFIAQNRPPDRQFAPMVRCARCGVHLPGSEAIRIGSQSFCSQEHARLGTGP